jgi:hypothetical protein
MALQRTDRPSLYGRTGLFKGVTIPLPSRGLVLGRESAGAGRLAFDESSGISRTHCTIRYDDVRGCFGIVDHGSSNGTFVMPEERQLVPEQETFLGAGQQVRLGKHTLFELLASSQTGAEPSGDLPRLAPGQRLDLAAIRVPYVRLYFAFVCLPSVFAILSLLGFLWFAVQTGNVAVVLIALGGGVDAGVLRLVWLALPAGVRARQRQYASGPRKYPQIHALVSDASELLGISPPTVVILQGHGLFEVMVARRFSRRGLLIITSDMLDDLTEHGSSRELMFFIGRQLGLIATGYFDYWFFKHTVGQFALLFHLAWLRRCHLMADRLGLLVCGDALASEQALLLITAAAASRPTPTSRPSASSATTSSRASGHGSCWGCRAIRTWSTASSGCASSPPRRPSARSRPTRRSRWVRCRCTTRPSAPCS